jgi:DNA-binding NarL/FixJ family response regulator
MIAEAAPHSGIESLDMRLLKGELALVNKPSNFVPDPLTPWQTNYLGLSTPEAALPRPPLLPQEIHQLDLALHGNNVAQAAQKTGYSKQEVTAYLHSAASKLGTTTRGANQKIAAVRAALDEGLISFQAEVPQPWQLLDQTEREVLEWRSRGFTRAEIARALSISEQNVAAHDAEIHRKFGTHTGIQAVRRGFELGVLAPPSQQSVEPAAEHLPQSILNPEQLFLVKAASLGIHIALIAHHSALSEDRLSAAYQAAKRAAGARTVSAAVEFCIQEKSLPLQQSFDERQALNGYESRVLSLVRAGADLRQLAHEMGTDSGGLPHYLRSSLLKIGAHSRPHAIRRLHELGIAHRL